MHPHPAGLEGDEAADGLDALDILQGHLKIFLPADEGREPLLGYVQALFIAGLGRGILPLRLAAASVGILTVAACLWLGRSWCGRRWGLLLGLAVALSYWHVELSRISVRPVMAPLVVALVLGFLRRVLARRRWGDALAGGVALGLGLYTYLATRTYPPLVALLIAYEALAWPERVARAWKQLALLWLTAAAVVLPLALYFWRHTEDFSNRQSQVFVLNQPGSPGALLAESAWRTLGGFVVHGDDSPFHNLPGRPVFGPVGAGLLLLGLAWWLGGFGPRQRKAPLRGRRLGPWVMLTLGTALLPGALTAESPHFQRLGGAIPWVYLAFVAGLALGYRWLRRWGRMAPLAVGAVFAIMAVDTYRTYFQVWPRRWEVQQAFHARELEMVAWLNALPARDPAPFFFADDTSLLRYLVPRYADGPWLREYTTLLPIDAARPRRYVVAWSALPPVVERYLPGARRALDKLDVPGHEGFVAFEVAPGDLPLATLAPADVAFGALHLTGWHADGQARPGGRITALLRWRVEQPGEENYGVSLHLRDPAGRSWAQADLQGRMSSGWPPGQEALSLHDLQVPPDAPPGAYQLEVSAAVRSYDRQPSAILRTLGTPSRVAQARVAPGAAPSNPASLAIAVDRDAALGLRLAGYEGPASARAGSATGLDLQWRASGPVAALPPLELLDAAGQVRVRIPATGWVQQGAPGLVPGEWLREQRAGTLPGNLPGGEYRWRLGALELGPLHVEGRTPNTTLPATQHPADAVFGGAIRLLGWDLEDAGPTGLRLTLHWQAVGPIERDYTVFTHLLAPDGAIAAQHDRPPLGGAQPTSGWLPGEVISDHYTLQPTRPIEGPLRVEVGWYDPATGARLRLASGADHLELTEISRRLRSSGG